MKKIPEPAIHHLLKTLADGAVFAKRAPDKQAPPYIIFQRIDREQWAHINGQSKKAQALFQIDCYAEGYYSSKGLAGRAEALLVAITSKTEITHDEIDLDGGETQSTVTLAGISLQNDVDLLDETDEPVLDRVSQTYLVTFYQ